MMMTGCWPCEQGITVSLSVYDWQTLKWQINYWNRRNLSCPTTSTTAMAVGFPCPFSFYFPLPTPAQHFVATVVWLAQWLPQRSTRVAKLQSKLLLELGNIEEIRIWICRLLDSIPSSEFAVRSSQLPFASFQFHFELRAAAAAAVISAQGNARQANHMWGSVAKVLPQSNNIYWKCIITWKVDANEQCLLLILMRFAALFEPQLLLLLLPLLPHSPTLSALVCWPAESFCCGNYFKRERESERGSSAGGEHNF